MIRPKPFKKVCEQCGWSKVYHPKSDVVDASWGLESKCPKCGSDKLSKTNDIAGVQSIISSIKDMFR